MSTGSCSGLQCSAPFIFTGCSWPKLCYCLAISNRLQYSTWVAHLSLTPVQASNLNTNRHRETEIGVKISRAGATVVTIFSSKGPKLHSFRWISTPGWYICFSVILTQWSRVWFLTSGVVLFWRSDVGGGVPMFHLHGEVEGCTSVSSLLQALLLHLHPCEISFLSAMPGRATIPLGSNHGQVVYSHCLPSFSASRNCSTKGSFRCLSGY